jgi:hypothetical protein
MTTFHDVLPQLVYELNERLIAMGKAPVAQDELATAIERANLESVNAPAEIDKLLDSLQAELAPGSPPQDPQPQ